MNITKLLIEGLISYQYDKLINNKVNLYEHEMSYINSIIVKDWYQLDGDDVLEYLKYLYELEYKYSMVTNNKFHGNPKRGDNIIKILKSKLGQLIPQLSHVLINVFQKWLDLHSLDDPRSWAEKRYDMYQEFEEGGSGYSVYKSILGEFKNGIRNDSEFSQVHHEIAKYVDSNPGDFPELTKCIEEHYSETNEYRRNDMYTELEQGLEMFNDDYGTEFTTEDEANQYIDEYEGEFYMSDIEINQFEDLVGSCMRGGIEILANLCHSKWVGKISQIVASNGEAFDDVRDTIEKHKEALENIEGMDLKKQSYIFNMALNSVHSSGDMLEHLSSDYNISYDDLEALSDSDTTEWDKELRLIGVGL